MTGKKVKCRLNSFSIMMYLIAMRCPSGVSKRRRCSSLRRNRLVCVFPICINYLRDGKSWALVDRNYDTRLIAVKEKISCDIPSLLLFLLLVSDDVTKLRRFCHLKFPFFIPSLKALCTLLSTHKLSAALFVLSLFTLYIFPRPL